MKKFVKKSKLTKDELKEFLKLTVDMDHKEDHSRLYRTMMNQQRREILKFIGYEVRTFEEIEKNCNISKDQINYHLSMLKQSLFIIESSEGWKASPRGLGFLENAMN